MLQSLSKDLRIATDPCIWAALRWLNNSKVSLMNNRTERTSRTKDIDGFLCCKIQTEPPKEKPKKDFCPKDFPDELQEFMRGLRGKKQH